VRIPGELIPIVLFIMVGFTIVFAPLARAVARRIDRDPGAGRSLPSDVGDRLERMEQAIDAIAVEVERISEGQRFASKLMAGQTDGARSDGASVARVPERR
jgi:hypothetical protein